MVAYSVKLLRPLPACQLLDYMKGCYSLPKQKKKEVLKFVAASKVSCANHGNNTMQRNMCDPHMML